MQQKRSERYKPKKKKTVKQYNKNGIPIFSERPATPVSVYEKQDEETG